MEGPQTARALTEFAPLFVLRYSATHRTEHNKIHRLDALDAYNQRLVKKIAVRGIAVKGLSGTNAYLFLESIEIFTNKAPEARLEFEIKQKNAIKRVIRKVGKNDNLFDLSNGLEQYKGFVVSDLDARTDTIGFTNGEILSAGEATGDVNETTLRRIQIRETIKAHLEKERDLFDQGIKVLSLFFIDQVAKYRVYDDDGEQLGEYAQIFEEEYNNCLNDVLELGDEPFQKYLKGISAKQTHNGYFSIDKKKSRFVDSSVKRDGETDDVDAYDLILRDKERLLSFEEPVRFIFSHSALREGWDNPNVFVICTLKHSDNTVSRRQEVGRGLRLAVNQSGDRIDDPATVHRINVLTVVANESYKDFVSGLQSDIIKTLSDRPTVANEAYFKGKIIRTDAGDKLEIDDVMARKIHRYLVKNDYTDENDQISQVYHDARDSGQLAKLPSELEPHREQIINLINSVFSQGQLPTFEDERARKNNPTNANFHKKEFLELWSRINQKAVYSVSFDSDELIEKSIKTLDKELKVTPLQYTIQKGQQTDQLSEDELRRKEGFRVQETTTERDYSATPSSVKYDLVGNLAEGCKLKRETIVKILTGINRAVFGLYKMNPEHFLREVERLINEQKATMIVEYLSYDPIDERYDIDIFTQQKPAGVFSKAMKGERHVFDYIFTDSKVEKDFVTDLDKDKDVVVYAKLPDSFLIPTPVGNYNPDWAIAFTKGRVKHVYFVAETKGNMRSMELRALEKSKIECARKFFAGIAKEDVRYDVVDSYSKLMDLVK